MSAHRYVRAYLRVADEQDRLRQEAVAALIRQHERQRRQHLTLAVICIALALATAVAWFT